MSGQVAQEPEAEEKPEEDDVRVDECKAGILNQQEDTVNPVISTESAIQTSPEDDELAKLLDSALEEFESQSSEEKQRNDSLPNIPNSPKSPQRKQFDPCPDPDLPDLNFEQYANSTASGSNVDDVLKNFMESDPILKDHWEKLAESCSKAGELSSIDWNVNWIY